jgi:quercetin dioxygenase-like cupin family protein
MSDQLPPIKRHITTHDPATGKATFSTDFDAVIEPDTALPTLKLYNCFTTETYPIDMAGDADLGAYKPHVRSMESLDLPNGIVARVTEFAPGGPAVMHRTVTLDYGVVLEGKVELQLDSGESRVLEKGDVIVQRGTMHAWRNLSETESARIFFVMQASKPIVVQGKELENYVPIHELFDHVGSN